MIVYLILIGIIVPIVIVEPLQDPVALPKLAVTAALTGCGLIWGAVLLAREGWPSDRWPARLWLPVAAFVLLNILAAVFAADWRWSLFGQSERYQGLFTVVLYVLLFGITAVSVRTTRDLRWLLLGLFVGGLAVSIYALLQKAGLDAFEDFWRIGYRDRPASTLGQANTFASYLVATISASAFLVIAFRERWQKAAIAAGIGAMALALIFTLSRSAYLAMLAVLVIWSAATVVWYVSFRQSREPTRRQLLSAAVGGVVAALLIVAIIAGAFAATPQGRKTLTEVTERAGEVREAEGLSVGFRLSLWRLAFQMIADRPLLGHGQDTFTLLVAEYRDRPDYASRSALTPAIFSSHNYFLDLAQGTGLLGLLAFLALVGSVFWHAGRRAFATKDDLLRAALLALSAGVVGYLAAVFFGFTESLTSWLLWVVLGAIVGLAIPHYSEASERSPARRGAEEVSHPETRERLVTRGALVVAGLTALLGVTALVWALTITAADLAAADALDARSRGQRVESARLAGRAVSLNPLHKGYLSQKAEAEASVSFETRDNAGARREAISVQETLLRRFHPVGVDVYVLAVMKLGLAELEGEPTDEAFELVERAVALDPFNLPLRFLVIGLYEGAGNGTAAGWHRVVIFCWSHPCD